MPHRGLVDFLEDLEHAGQLTRLEQPVDPAIELGSLAAQSAQAGGPALLFCDVKGCGLPVLCNLLATENRICRALGVASLDEVSDRLGRLLNPPPAEGWFERLKGGSRPVLLESMGPRKVRAAAVQQIVRHGSDVDLGQLPLLKILPDEAAGAICQAVVLSIEANSLRPAAGRYDIERIDRSRLAVAWSNHDAHARLFGEYRARGEKMPLAVVIGGDPSFLLAAWSPLPPGSDVCAAAGLLCEKSLDVVACQSVDLEVPADAQIVLEGFCDPAAPPATIGPHCGPTGRATRPRPAAVMQVTAMTHRANPIFAATAPGRPPHEACAAARAMQRAFRPLTQLAMPELVDYDLPEFGAARHWATVSIRKTHPGHGCRAAHAAWNLPALQFAKMLVLVDADVDVRNRDEVLAAVACHMRPGRDLITAEGPADPFDPASPPGAAGCYVALDATKKLPEES